MGASILILYSLLPTIGFDTNSMSDEAPGGLFPASRANPVVCAPKMRLTNQPSYATLPNAADAEPAPPAESSRNKFATTQYRGTRTAGERLCHSSVGSAPLAQSTRSSQSACRASPGVDSRSFCKYPLPKPQQAPTLQVRTDWSA
jgi:hypothetical protein